MIERETHPFSDGPEGRTVPRRTRDGARPSGRSLNGDHRQRGYVLLMVLLLLALAAVALAGICRTTLRRSTAAAVAMADLQHRWGAVTAQYTLLDDAANVLDRAEGSGGPPLVTLHATFDLGRVRFDVDLCDEQAKANVNGLLAWRPQQAAALVAGLAKAGGGRLAPRLPAVAKPLHAISTSTDDAPPTDTGRPPPVVGSLTDVFPGAGWADLWPSAAGNVSANLTAFGDGRVNPRRASAAVLSAVCGLTGPQAAELSRLGRAAGNTFDAAGAAAAVGATADVAAVAGGRVVDGSFTQSVWVVATDGRRTWRTWAVRDGTDGEHPRTFAGQW